jgi:signal transduction histidine kinase
MRSYRLLIVDHDPVDRQKYSDLLAHLDPDIWHIQQAANGAVGLAALRGDKFGCVLLDSSLPDMTAFEFLTAVPKDQPCAIVVVIDPNNEALAVEAMQRGAQDYLVKDQANANSLQHVLTRAVVQKDLQQRLAASTLDLATANDALEQEVVTRKTAEAALRVAEDATEQANQAKTRFVAMATHELRTPLNGILGDAQILRIETELSTRQDAHVGSMMQAGRHLLEMIERVLDFANDETARMELLPVEISVHDLTEGCIAFIRPMVAQRGLSLRVVNAHDAPRKIVADPARLRQVLLNLLGNAVKYTDAGSVELRVLAGVTPGGLRIEVADTGRGIDEASRQRLFQEFERSETATSAEETGLGLAIAMRIVKLMGGTINYVPNQNVANATGAGANVGSVFWFELPAADQAPAPLLNAVKGVSPPSGRRVLVVDDIKINRDIIGAFLDAAGHAVILAEGGQESVRLAAEQQFDLILMDVRMPEMDGFEATRRIRTLPASRGQVPILALTAYAFPDQVAQCLSAGMDGHLPKPVDYQTLINAVDVAITRAPQCRPGDIPAAPPSGTKGPGAAAFAG